MVSLHVRRNGEFHLTDTEGSEKSLDSVSWMLNEFHGKYVQQVPQCTVSAC